ncbi:DUF6527 family protein [Pseudomonas syringae]|uniref:Ammonia monooxygenase n=1 Tax=Pseudomonas syringae TaxID=317 RepID=A0A085V3Z2_PSESX|nr:DUF6527 family protein [Pseudomonas syringae]KFE50155.1 ammonia monooxygenase [Pseudomonas syringae]
MSKIKSIGRCLGEGADGSIWFFCDGCGGPHSIKVNSPGTPGPNWCYNGNPDTPTFTPSVLARTTGAPDGRSVMTDEEVLEYDAIYKSGGRDAVFASRFGKVCHSFVTDGRIQYLGDCTHALAGQTVVLPNWEESWAKW